MKKISSLPLVLCASICFASAALAEKQPTLTTLPVVLGESKVHPKGGSRGLYSVSVSGPMSEKSQEIRFIAYWDTTDEQQARNQTTRTASVLTGKSKTLQQVTDGIKDAFSKFLSGAPANQELYKIGDIKFGGELRVVVESAEVLRFDYLKPSGNEAIRFGKKEIQEFVSILNSAK